MSSSTRSIFWSTHYPFSPTYSPQRIASHPILITAACSLILPLAVIPFVLRCAAQVQLASPRRIHPTRSLRFFLTGWTAVNIANIVLHSVEGSRGTKGDSWAGKGVILDFVGQGSSNLA